MPDNTQRQSNGEGIFVIFGVDGDLSKRKLLPALYELLEKNLLSQSFRIIGTTRRDTQVDDIVSHIKTSLHNSGNDIDDKTLDRLRASLQLVKMDIELQGDYAQLENIINQTEASIGRPVSRLFYLAVPPKMVTTIVGHLGNQGLHKAAGTESRLLVEKPFGYDTRSAEELIGQMEKVFTEDVIYRVDHYLAKETVQNILTFRFKNPLFEAVWDKSTVEHIMITASETIGIEGRVNFYENTGALRDLIQSHLLQLLALVAMEKPSDNSSQSIHQAKLSLLNDIKPISPEDVAPCSVRGRYETYLQEVSNPDSITETYAALKLNISNQRWQDVPVLLRAGKSMAEKVTEITLIFKPSDPGSSDRNALTIRIQPNEGIVLSLLAKKPSFAQETELVQMNFSYREHFGGAKHPDAYERVLVDAIKGDKTLFTTDKEVLAAWKIIENVIQSWSKNGDDLETYPNGSWGPAEADELANSCQAQWRTKGLHLTP
jgi:glucose-6-phosphate 1-dehydrogenase